MSTDERVPKIYTRTGDKGKTSLIGGKRVSKADHRLDAYGTVDELNSVIGVLIHDLGVEFSSASSTLPSGTKDLKQEAQSLTQALTTIQNDLFNVGSQLACEDPTLRSQLPGVTDEKIAAFEKQMDQFTAELKPLKNFILPGGSRSAGFAHIARTVCRRAERICVSIVEINQPGEEIDPVIIRYLNRLSDFLFVLARYLNHCLDIDEPIWGGKKS